MGVLNLLVVLPLVAGLGVLRLLRAGLLTWFVAWWLAFLVLFGLVIFAQYAVVQSLFDIGVRLRRPDYP